MKRRLPGAGIKPEGVARHPLVNITIIMVRYVSINGIAQRMITLGKGTDFFTLIMVCELLMPLWTLLLH